MLSRTFREALVETLRRLRNDGISVVRIERVKRSRWGRRPGNVNRTTLSISFHHLQDTAGASGARSGHAAYARRAASYHQPRCTG